MRRHDDRHGTTRLYVGRLSSRTRSRDLERIFSKYGRVRDVDMKHDFAFIDFSDPRDADDARYSLNGRDFDGSRLLVEFARGGSRGTGGSREYAGRGPPPGSGRCFNCGLDGHWARDCKSGDWKNKCYRCGERGHIERNCQNSPKNLKRERSYSRSPSPRRGRSRSRSYSRDHSYSRSRSPPRRGGRKGARESSRSPSRSPVPRKKITSPPLERKRSFSPDGSTSPPQKVRPSSPKQQVKSERNESDYSGSPRRVNNSSRSPRRDNDSSRSPSQERESSPVNRRRYRSPETNGRSASPRDAEDDGNHDSARGSESPQD